MTYEFFDNTICVSANDLISTLELNINTYVSLTRRGLLNVIRRGGNGRTALIEVSSMREDIKEKVIALAGDPKVSASKSVLESHIEVDTAAIAYFRVFRKKNGSALSPSKQLRYCTNANILNAIDVIYISKKTNARRLTGNKSRLWTNISNAVNELPSNVYPHSLPGNCRSLERAYKRYKQDGHASLIHGQTDNENRLIITGEVADYILATYCLPNKPKVPTVLGIYDNIRIDKGWSSLSESAVQLYLDRPEVKRIWTLARHGKEAYKNAYGHTLSRDKSQWFPNAFWCIDGSKLDWMHYEDENQLGVAAKLKMNPVFDVFSEVIIGNSYSTTENHTDHFTALKSAINFTGRRPYKITYDNQSGHKSKRMQELYNNLVARNGGVHMPTRAYAHSNPAEGLFSRFQQQIIALFWFSDKQSITSRTLDSRPNMDFLMANKHRLMTKEDLFKAWELAVKQWNNAPHPSVAGKTRLQVYNSQSPFVEEIDFLEAVNLFWINETKAITYKKHGLTMKLKGETYLFEVLDENGKIDIEFRRLNIGKKFIVRYDPETMDQYIQLLEVDAEGNRIYVANARPKHTFNEIPVLMQPGDATFHEDFKVRDIELERDQKAVESLRRRTGITPERLIEEQEFMIKMGGNLPKDIRSKVESEQVFNYL